MLLILRYEIAPILKIRVDPPPSSVAFTVVALPMVTLPDTDSVEFTSMSPATKISQEASDDHQQYSEPRAADTSAKVETTNLPGGSVGVKLMVGGVVGGAVSLVALPAIGAREGAKKGGAKGAVKGFAGGLAKGVASAEGCAPTLHAAAVSADR